MRLSTVLFGSILVLLSLSPLHGRHFEGYGPELRNDGRRLNLFGGGSYGLGGTVKFRTNNQAFSASAALSPGYFATLVTDSYGHRNSGLAAALAYAVDVDPRNWISYASGDAVDEQLLNILARGPDVETDATLIRENGELTGESYAKARGNFIAFSRAYVQLLDEAQHKGLDLYSRSQSKGKAVSEKYRKDIEVAQLYDNFFANYESEARVLAVVSADVVQGHAKAKQKATAETDEKHGGKHCARVWVKGEVVEGVALTEQDLIKRGVHVDIFEC